MGCFCGFGCLFLDVLDGFLGVLDGFLGVLDGFWMFLRCFFLVFFHATIILKEDTGWPFSSAHKDFWICNPLDGLDVICFGDGTYFKYVFFGDRDTKYRKP